MQSAGIFRGEPAMDRIGIVTGTRATRPTLVDRRYRLLFAGAIASAVLLVSMLVDAAMLG
jgi:hypothetical protein